MSLIQEILSANEKFCQNPPADYTGEDHATGKLPKKHLAVLTCMDTRLVNFLEAALGISRGDAKFIKNAGNCVTGVFDSAVRSLLVCIYELGVNEIIVIGHHECGMAKTSAKSLKDAMLSRGVPAAAIHMIDGELTSWADGFLHPEQNVRDVVEKLRLNPLIPDDVTIHGLMFHPRTGKLNLVE